jgi:hypothetical protein
MSNKLSFPHKDKERLTLQSQVDAYLAQGNSISQHAPHETGLRQNGLPKSKKTLPELRAINEKKKRKKG